MIALFRKNYLFLLILLLIILKGILWITLIPVLQTPDAERHFSTIIWYAEPIEKILEAKQDAASENVLDSSTYNIPDEFKQFLEISQFEQARLNPNNHQTFRSDSNSGLAEEKIKDNKLSANFRRLPPTIVDYPPLYYKTSSWIYSVFRKTSILNRIYLIELYSLFLSIIVLLFAYKSARLLNFSKKSASLFTGIIAMQPMFSQVSISINPDVLLILGMTIFTFFSILIIKKGFNWKNVLGIITAAIIASYAKTTGLMVWPIIAILLLTNLKKRSFIICSTLIPSFFIISYALKPAFFTNKFNILTTELFSIGNIFPNYFDAIATYSSKHFSLIEQYRLFASYWGYFGWLDYSLNKYIYLSIFLLIMISIISFFIFLIKKNKNQGNEKKIYISLLVFMVIFQIAIVYLEFSLFKNSGEMFGLQGRYFMPSIVAYFLILSKGFQFLFKKFNQEIIFSILFVLMVFLNMYSIVSVILPSYYL